MKRASLPWIGVSLLLLSMYVLQQRIYVPKHFPSPVYDLTQETISDASIAFGRQLFYDPVLSADSTISCASCHSPFNAFAHADHDLSHGIRDQMGTRNAPALMNLAWHDTFMWDGAINHLDVQPLAPISHPKEMGETMSHVVTKLNRSKRYREMSAKAFGNEEITGERALKALAHFQATLISAGSKYDMVVNGTANFTLQEENGYRMFQRHCNHCHREPLFSTYTYTNNGLPVDTTLNDYGRMAITGHKEDSLHFKIPTLRNLRYSQPYMHDGRFRKLRQVLDHYTNGIVQHASLDPFLQKPIVLDSDEKSDLIAFLMTLSDSSFVFNPALGPPRRQ